MLEFVNPLAEHKNKLSTVNSNCSAATIARCLW